MAGVGKTALACVLVARLKDRYGDADIYLNLRGADEDRNPATPADALAHVIEAKRYAEELEEERSRLTRIGKEGVSIDVESSLRMSWRYLDADAARVFRRLSVFATATFDAKAEEAVCEDPRHERLSELLRSNLVEYNEAVGR